MPAEALWVSAVRSSRVVCSVTATVLVAQGGISGQLSRVEGRGSESGTTNNADA